jgi:serine phosphatase RsbU (regulator of sigma subunit)
MSGTPPPPPAANIIPPALDGEGFLESNTFELYWNPPPASDVAGYTWDLEYLGSSAPYRGMNGEEFAAAAEERFSQAPAPPPRIRGTGLSAAYDNQDNGVWRFSVSAVDEVGNTGPPSRVFFRTDKYIPHTYITYVDARQDEQGIVFINLIGRGFAEGGELSRVFLEREGEPPLRLDFFPGRGDFSVRSDREVSGLRLEQLEKGSYRVGVEHPLRGVFIHPRPVGVDEKGTVKFGDYSRAWEPSWSLRPARRHILEPASLLSAAVLAFSALGILVFARGISLAAAEGAAIRLDAAALITGDFMPSEKKKRLRQLKRRGIGLRLKLASFTIALVLLVVAMVSTPLYLIMTRTQRETLLRGLWDRSSVLLEGLASSARIYLPSQNTLELGFLLAQTDAIPEARYVTITGLGGGAAAFSDHIWASNDPDILVKIDTAEFTPGVSRLRDSLSPRLEAVAGELNARSRAEVGEISQSISGLTREGLALAGAGDPQSRQRFQDIQVSVRSLEIRLSARLAEIGREIGSEPAFSVEKISLTGDQRFIFFKPVLFRQGAEDSYFRGLIRLEVSTDSIVEAITEGQANLLRVILIVALAAIAIGAAGALVVSSLIIRPISTLVSHVERIRDTEDKAKLEGVNLAIRSRDEIAVLGATINDMTHGLVKAAQAAADLSIGKEIQKKFIPLELDREGNKLSAGHKDSPYARFFGYYEGAKGVSGDYFDYQDLDGRYYALIKCDVAGKGIPAALIMIQVATMFLNHFKNWKPTEKGMRIEELVYQINDFIETLGFKGRFAAFTLCLFDTQTGLLRFCNAGDNLVHLYDASEGRFRTVTLAETPATGVLPNILVESKGGYRVETLRLDPGDLLLLYTDGIEEAKRKFRDRDFREILCAEGPPDSPHANHSSGQGDEEMGADRVAAIVNAVQGRGTYTLYKYHNPEGEIGLSFDFSRCEGTAEETVMALVAVEKIFRCYQNPRAGEDSRVLVDRRVDAFLKKHFLQYRNYCSYTRDGSEGGAYMYYTHLEEDAQYDDLTILGIMRK